MCNVLLELKPRSFDTPLRGVFKPGYSGSSCSDVHGGIPVRIHDHVAACTGKVESRAMATTTAQMACLRRVGRINKHQRHTSRLRLVGHKLPQLVEAPTVVAIPLRFVDLRPLSDALEVFQGNLPLGGLGCFDKLFADRVVDRSHMPCLSAREPFQKSLGFFRAFALERPEDLRVVGTQALHLRGFVGACIRIDRYTASAKINTKRASGRVGRWSRTFELDMQEERAITPFDECGTRRRLAFEPSLLVCTKRGLKWGQESRDACGSPLPGALLGAARCL